MDKTSHAPHGAAADLTTDAAAAALLLGWQSAHAALLLLGRGDLLASLTAAHSALKAIEASTHTLAVLGRVHG